MDKLLSFIPEIEPQLNSILKSIARQATLPDFPQDTNRAPLFIGSVDLCRQYGRNKTVRVLTDQIQPSNRNQKWTSLSICEVDSSECATIILYPNAFPIITDTTIKCTLIHELTHAVDGRPWKMRLKAWRADYAKSDWMEYYTEDGEFSAFSNEIIYSVIQRRQNKRKSFVCKGLFANIFKMAHSKKYASDVQRTAIAAWLLHDHYANNQELTTRFQQKGCAFMRANGMCCPTMACQNLLNASSI